MQLNCTYSNYTEAAATCSAAQQHTNCPADVFWSAVQPAVWYVYILYPMIRFFKQIQLTVNAPPQLQGATQHPPMFLSGACEGAYVTSVQIRWRNSGILRRPTCSSRTSTHTPLAPFSAFCLLEFAAIVPWCIQQFRRRLWRPKPLFPGHLRTCSDVSGWSDVGHWRFVLHWLGVGGPQRQ